jgi:hypothetical protein
MLVMCIAFILALGTVALWAETTKPCANKFKTSDAEGYITARFSQSDGGIAVLFKDMEPTTVVGGVQVQTMAGVQVFKIASGQAGCNGLVEITDFEKDLSAMLILEIGFLKGSPKNLYIIAPNADKSVKDKPSIAVIDLQKMTAEFNRNDYKLQIVQPYANTPFYRIMISRWPGGDPAIGHG